MCALYRRGSTLNAEASASVPFMSLCCFLCDATSRTVLMRAERVISAEATCPGKIVKLHGTSLHLGDGAVGGDKSTGVGWQEEDVRMKRSASLMKNTNSCLVPSLPIIWLFSSDCWLSWRFGKKTHEYE